MRLRHSSGQRYVLYKPLNLNHYLVIFLRMTASSKEKPDPVGVTEMIEMCQFVSFKLILRYHRVLEPTTSIPEVRWHPVCIR